MKEEFTVLFDRMPVGKAEVIRQGLYYRISSRYRLPSGDICRLIIKWPGGWENVGIPVPDGDGFLLTKRIPTKKIPATDMSFHLIPVGIYPSENEHPEDGGSSAPIATENTAEEFENTTPADEETTVQDRQPISEEKPFDALDRLDAARLDTADGQTFVVFEEVSSQIQLKTDRTVVGAEDIRIDRSSEDLIAESV